MSRIGRKPIPVPAGVKIATQPGTRSMCRGPKGKPFLRDPAWHHLRTEGRRADPPFRATEASRSSRPPLARWLPTRSRLTSGFQEGARHRGSRLSRRVEGQIGFLRARQVAPRLNFRFRKAFRFAVEKQTHICRKRCGTKGQGRQGCLGHALAASPRPDPYKQKGVRILPVSG